MFLDLAAVRISRKQAHCTRNTRDRTIINHTMFRQLPQIPSIGRGSCFFKRSISFSTGKSNQYPPTYFSNPSPGSSGSLAQQANGSSSQFQPPQMQMQTPGSGSGSPRFSVFKDIGMGVALVALVYFAVDNYNTRLTLQQKAFENAMEQQKAVALAQMSFNNARKKREIQILNERKNFQKREMKMALHVALLRKQLQEAGVQPVDINEAIAEFERNVKMENSLANVTGASLWIVDDADIKSYVPSSHEYDRK